MSVQVENLEKSMAKLTIEVSAEQFEAAMQKAYQEQGQNSAAWFPQGQGTSCYDRKDVRRRYLL